MWIQNYNPLGNIYLSALVAALPIVFFLLALTLLKMKGIVASLITLIISVCIASFLFGMPLLKVLSAAFLGILNGFWPIGFIIIMAVWLYKISVKTGKFTIIQSSISSISSDQRLQLLLIGFCFNAFLEGAAGFGVPIAISAALLVELGFRPLYAASLCLIANAASGAFGAIGIPIIVGAQVGGMETLELTQKVAFILPVISFIIPFLLVFILDKFKGIKETFPALLFVSIIYSGLQLLVMVTLGPELANIIASLASMGGLAVFLRFWQPKSIFRLDSMKNGKQDDKKYSFKDILIAWSPFYILTGVIVIWSMPFFKSLFADNGPLSFTVLKLKMPFLHQEVLKIPPIAPEKVPYDAIFKLDVISATGTAILVSVMIVVLFSKNLNVKGSLHILGETIKDFYISILTVCFILGFANIATFSGLSSTLGLALAKTGDLFPLFSPVLGWLGVFLTGSVVSSNALFGHLQGVTGNQIGADPKLLIASNTSGGVMGKLISPQSVAIATAAVQKTGEESSLFRMTIKYSLFLLIYVSIITYVLSI
ncbi:L-lactate permease [Bacillus sp. 03113]|uniref:L-lactate permease n=1 Tax=Bacillus sp. 03113 TaxID=2578211 RepID=UPI001143D32C|nr:L-lactate permease [Bacillus sp. 03113]